MKSEFAFIALPISALVVPSAFAVRYLTVDQAQQAIFPGKSFTAAPVKLTSVQRKAIEQASGVRSAAPVKLTSVQRKAIEQASGVRVLHDEQQVWRVSGGGWFIVDEVVGKHEFITYAAGLNPEGSVKQIEIMGYRETYGGQIRDQKWRAQFMGKTSKSTLKLDSDIKNISGATLSC